eukprot:Gb_10912 [translate_table: standard]
MSWCGFPHNSDWSLTVKARRFGFPMLISRSCVHPQIINARGYLLTLPMVCLIQQLVDLDQRKFLSTAAFHYVLRAFLFILLNISNKRLFFYIELQYHINLPFLGCNNYYRLWVENVYKYLSPKKKQVFLDPPNVVLAPNIPPLYIVFKVHS